MGHLFYISLLIVAAYAHTEHSIDNGTYKLMTHGNPNGTIDFYLTVKTLGWVGVGVGPNPNMIGADMVIGTVNGSTVTFVDMHVPANTPGSGTQPTRDTKEVSDWELLAYSENATTTLMSFRRLYKTADPNPGQDFEIKNEDLYIIMAYGLNDNVTHHEGRRGFEKAKIAESLGGGAALSSVSLLIALCAAVAFALY